MDAFCKWLKSGMKGVRVIALFGLVFAAGDWWRQTQNNTEITKSKVPDLEHQIVQIQAAVKPIPSMAANIHNIMIELQLREKVCLSDQEKWKGEQWTLACKEEKEGAL